jgi:hypothetical protein
MTETNDQPPAAGQHKFVTEVSKQPEKEPVIVIPCSLVRYVRDRKLSGVQYELWLYLYERDPYGNRWIDIPTPAEIAQELGCDPRTVQRAAQRLQDCDLFDFEIKHWKARNTTVTTRSRQNSTGKEIHLRTKRSQSPHPDQIVGNGIKRSKGRQSDPVVQSDKNPKRPVEKGLTGVPTDAKQCTNNRTINFKEQTIGTTPTPHPVDPGIDREDPGTTASPTMSITQLIEESGIRVNKTIQTALADLQQNSESPAATCRAVENALSALQEQRRLGKVKNPGGFFVAALRRGFTANAAKRQHRNTPLLSPPPPSSLPPDLMSVELAIDQALLQGDRAWVFAKLQQLWLEGWHDQVEWLLSNRRDWAFAVTKQGVTDDR